MSDSEIKKPKLEIKTCYLSNITTDRVYDSYESDVLYSLSMIRNKFKECSLDTTEFDKTLLILMKTHKEILAQAKKILLESPNIIGSEIIRWIRLLPKYLITTQLSKDDFTTYAELVQKCYANIVALNLTSNDIKYTQICKEFIVLIDFSFKYPDITGIIHYLDLIIFSSKEYKDFITLNTEYRDEYKNTIKEYLYKLTEQYYIDNDDYALKTEESTDYTIIKKGSYFYKGVRSSSLSKLTDLKDYFWLAFDIPNAMKYIVPDNDLTSNLKELCSGLGYVGIYRIKEDIKLLDLSDIKNIESLFELIDASASSHYPSSDGQTNQASPLRDEDVIKALKDTFTIMIKNNNKILTRNSHTDTDLVLAKWMCQNGYAGYTANKIGTFSSEIMLCNPKKYIEYLGYYDIKDLGIHYCNDEYLKYDIELLHM